ncbi:glycosyltransferase [Parasphingopyxis lamellibrachiae]|uniref:Glycosyltransferase involved in cell wall biosynthesis n=1 Tax=Parasphingopyxis lamellibrachiae TaxID=680125 RepID=A0A3D9FD63_9SPHN|nr:glycosyltransferase [Parasphingopyxis lamellibrachiae]RED15765.1 glycosyltransferase involved in cell wall biosynthesis [Parasphingopyxis lamellibrachiae]
MTNIAFFEPAYAAHNLRDWEIRGSYKYPSLLGNLHEQAAVTLLMRDLPPEDDIYRRRLETEHGARFVRIDALDDAGEHAADMLAADYGAAIAEHAPDIVSTLNGRMIGYNFALARAARAAGVDFVYRIAGNDIATQMAVQEAQGRPVAATAFHGTLMAQERYAAEAARTVIVMGGTERARAETLVSDSSKIRICRRGVDRAHFSPRAGAPERCDHILFVGRDSEEKGIDLIEAAAAILAEERPDLTFTIAGDFAAREEGNRRYLGFHDYAALPGLYRDHDALLLPARSEGFPQVVMEAMTCGLPAILSQGLFARDFGTEDGVELVDLDPRGIAEAIIRWHDDPALFTASREQALSHAAAHFDADANGALYHRALLGEGE